jgi:lipoate-protein ligase A
LRPTPIAYLDCTLPQLEANLALDEALLRAVEERGQPPVLRLWESSEFAVVLGASGRIREEVHRDACRADRVRIYRRSSGGGTVVIGPGALNFTVVLPAGFAPGLEAVDVAQRFVLERVAASLRLRGTPAVVQGSGDLTLDGRKFAGSAQRRLRRHFLVHASVLYAFPLDRISRYLAIPRRQPAYREGRPHEEFVANLGLPRAEVEAAIRASWLPQARAPAPAGIPEDLVESLIAEKFGDPAWIERF